MSAKIATALHAVMEACGYVQKTGKNQFHGYRYAGEADLLDKLRPAMVQHGLLLLPSGKSVTGPDEHGNVTVAIEYTLAHRDGDIWPDKLVAFGCGNDRAKNGTVGDKGVYKALTGANKYLLFKLFQIETGDDPEQDDGATYDHSSAPQQGRNAAGNPPPGSSHKPPAATLSEVGEEYRQEMMKAATKDDLGHWMAANTEPMKLRLGEAEASAIRTLAAARYRELPEGNREAAE